MFLWVYLFFLVGNVNAQIVTTFNYTGAKQTYTVPSGVTSIEVEVIGAQGGNAIGSAVGWGDGDVDIKGGLGGRVICTLPVTPGESLEIYVGGQGGLSSGGFNGGGNPAICSGTEVIAAGGGGGSDIRQGGSEIGDRVVVAGGGGGASGNANTNYASPDFSGAGGGLMGANSSANAICTLGEGGGATTGGNGGNNSCWCNGTEVAGAGSLGQGGNSICAPSGLSTCSCDGTGCTSGGGGGGGYYGGGAGIAYAGGGGGSSYTSGSVTSVTHEQGYKEGNGQVIIRVPCQSLSEIDLGVTITGADLVSDAMADAYQWIDCQNLTRIDGETNKSFSPADNGNYACEITLNGCIDTTECFGLTSSLDDFFMTEGISIYPLPVSEDLFIELKEGNMTIEILSVSGEVLDRRQIVAGQNKVDVTKLNAGFYVISFINDGNVYTSPLVVK